MVAVSLLASTYTSSVLGLSTSKVTEFWPSLRVTLYSVPPTFTVMVASPCAGFSASMTKDTLAEASLVSCAVMVKGVASLLSVMPMLALVVLKFSSSKVLPGTCAETMPRLTDSPFCTYTSSARLSRSMDTDVSPAAMVTVAPSDRTTSRSSSSSRSSVSVNFAFWPSATVAESAVRVSVTGVSVSEMVAEAEASAKFTAS